MSKQSSSSIKSYVRRAGRLSSRQKKGLQDCQQYLLAPPDEQVVDVSTLFDRQAPVVLDVGFGMGKALLAQAQAAPELNFIGVDVYAPGVGALLADIDSHGLTNLRVWHADAMEVLTVLPTDSIQRVQLFFPDPWPKNRHAKRRLLQQPFLDQVMRVLKRQGCFHMATDWQPYAWQAMALLEQQVGWVNQAGVNQFVSCPAYRPHTKYQLRGQRLGHAVYDLCYDLG